MATDMDMGTDIDMGTDVYLDNSIKPGTGPVLKNFRYKYIWNQIR
jgi:hypothetical protein